ncbi:MAG TPA: hypothetical protein PKI32_09410, partial [Opitutales bacterium]|nr:hypothetical protein [Opitutales bacterium]
YGTVCAAAAPEGNRDYVQITACPISDNAGARKTIRVMKTLVFGAAVALGGMIVAGCAPALPTARLDPGGVTFDFQKASDTRFCIPRADTPGNIVDRAPWEDGICDVHHGKVKTADPVRRKVRDGMRWHQEEGVCRVEKLAALDAIAGKVDGKPLAPNVSGAFSKRVMLPDAKGGAWRISFYCQARHNLDGGLNYYLVYFKRRDPQTGRWVAVNSAAGREYVAYPFPDGWGRWNAFSHGVEIPAGCEAFELIMRTDGIGEMTFKDVGFFRAAPETAPVSLVVSPHGLMGGDFALSCGQPGALGYSIRKNTDDRIDVRKCLFRLTLPKGVEYLGSSFAENATVKRTSRTDGGLDVTFAPRPTLEFGRSFGSRNHMLALLRTNRPAGPLGQAILDFLSPEGTPLAKPAAIDLVAMDAIAPARKPEHYANGVYPRGDTLSFGDESLSRLYADFMKTCGVDWIITASDSDLDYANWRAAGFRHVTRQFNWTNGYGTQFWQGRPEDEKFVVDPTSVPRHGPTWDSYIARGLCPISVLNDKSFFLTNTLPREIDAPLHGADGLWANWEPFMFTGRGCNCATCQSEYAKWRSKTGGSVGDFRSEVHGRMVKKIDRLARRRTPEAGATGFIPGVSWREMASSWRENDPSPESRPIDYAGDLA